MKKPLKKEIEKFYFQFRQIQKKNQRQLIWDDMVKINYTEYSLLINYN